MLCMEYTQQLVLLDYQKRGWRHGRSRPHPDRLARHAALAKKVARPKHCDDRFFSGPIHYGEFHTALLDIHDALRRLTLRVNRFASSKFCNSSRHPCGIEEDLRVKCSGSSILFYCFWFHIQVEVPSLHGHFAPAFILTRRVLLELFKREQLTVLVAFSTWCSILHRPQI